MMRIKQGNGLGSDWAGRVVRKVLCRGMTLERRLE